MVTGRGSKVFRYGTEVSENQFIKDNFSNLVKTGALVLIEGTEDFHPDANVSPVDFKTFILEHTIDEIKAELQKDLQAFPENEWIDIDNHEDLIQYLGSKIGQMEEAAKIALNVTEEEAAILEAQNAAAAAEATEATNAAAEGETQAEPAIPAEEGKTDAAATDATAPAEDATKAVDEFGLKDKLNGPEKVFDKTFDEWKVQDMKDKLDELKIEFDSKALKADLWELLKKG